MVEKQTEKKTVNNSEMERLRRAVNRIAETEDGKIVFNYLMALCGFSVSSLVINPVSNEINSKSTIYHEARKTVYYNLRGLIEKEHLKEIEYLQIKEDAENVN